MNAYIYQADIYCEKCAQAIIARLRKPLNTQVPDTDDESSYDSSEYPKGPYSDGGGEADTPQHCGACREFLENPLTSDGLQYVQDNQRDEWDSFYSIDRNEQSA